MFTKKKRASEAVEVKIYKGGGEDVTYTIYINHCLQ